MKNKDIICAGLLAAIIVLIGIAICYYVIKSDTSDKDNFGSSGTPSINEPNKSEEDNDETESGSTTQNPSGSSGNSGSTSTGNGILRSISTYEEFNTLISRDTGAFYVFGREGCSYCELYIPVLNAVTKKYDIEINYIDMAKLSSEDYYNVMNSPLKIPAKCHKTGTEVELKEGFGTPLGLFIKNGQTYDCIRGYKEQSNLIKEFQNIGYIN